MDTTNSSKNQQRRVEDRKPVEVIDWAAPDAPAVPLSPAATSGTDEFMVYGRAGNRRADLEAKLRDALAAGTPGSAATSGDAPADLEQRLRVQAVSAFGPEGFALLTEADDEIARLARIESAAAPADAPAAFAKRYSELLCENRRLKAQVESAAAPATASGDELPPLSDVEYQNILGPVLSREGMRRYRNADPINLDPSDLRAMIDRARAAVSAATKPTADLSGLTRYEPIYSSDEGSQMAVAANGEWLHIDDVQSLLATKPAAAPAVPIELMGVREEVEEGSGFWRSCSGCHESNEGYPNGPHSAVFGCALGNGCSECGGIGAVWDNNDYEAMARDWDKPDAASNTGAAQTAEQVRDQALEEAAVTAESTDVATMLVRSQTWDDGVLTRDNIVRAIRALKRPTPTHSSEAGDE